MGGGQGVKMSESRILARERGIRARASRGKGGFHCEGRKEGSKEEREGKQEEPP